MRNKDLVDVIPPKKRNSPIREMNRLRLENERLIKELILKVMDIRKKDDQIGL